MAGLGIFVGLDLIMMVILYTGNIFIDISGYRLNLIIVSSGLLGGICGPLYHFNCVKYFRSAISEKKVLTQQKKSASGVGMDVI